MRNFDLSGGKRERLDGSRVPASTRPVGGQPATLGMFRIAIWLGLALAVGFAIAIFAGGHPLLGPLTPRDAEGAGQVPGPEANAVDRGREAQQALDDAMALSAEAEAVARQQLRDAEEQIERARAAAGPESADMFDEAERNIAKARAQLDEASRRD